MEREREGGERGKRDPLNIANTGVLQAGAVSSQIREFPRLIVAFLPSTVARQQGTVHETIFFTHLS